MTEFAIDVERTQRASFVIDAPDACTALERGQAEAFNLDATEWDDPIPFVTVGPVGAPPSSSEPF